VPNEEDTLAHPEQPRFLLGSWLWAVTLFVSFGAIVAIAFGALNRGSSFEEERAKARAEKLKAAHGEWDKAAASYGWIDKAKGVARIPIQRAMELTLADLQAKQPTAAGPIATPTPAEASPAPAPAAGQPANAAPAVPPGTAGGSPAASPTPAPKKP
jgi:hypothetical protein